MKWQEISFISFQSELVTAVLGPQVPWQSSLQTFKKVLQLKACKVEYNFLRTTNVTTITCVFVADPCRLPCIQDTSEP